MEGLAKKINELIKETVAYRRYLEYKNKVECDEYLSDLKNKMMVLKKEMCKGNKQELINDYNKLEIKYKGSILVKEYEKSKEEVEVLLKNITDILSLE